MRLTYEPNNDVAYIRLREGSEAVETVRVSDEINIDLAAYGIELLDANDQRKNCDDDPLVLVDDTCTERAIPLAP